jgi:hypothetical protein
MLQYSSLKQRQKQDIIKEGHSSMLVHLDMKIAVHEQLGRVLNDYKSYVLKNYKKLEAAFKNIWEEEKKKNNFSTVKYLFDYSDNDERKYALPEYKSLVLHINTVLNKLQVVVDNSAHPLEERLDYSKDKNMVVIVIGGNTLSRGLTLDGLLVSYFHRTSSMYDTLLQMGRWFGYRIGYEDLARLYTTKEIAFRFSELADVEEELREQCSNYDFEITPAEMSFRIRTLPSLQVTRKMAMQNAISTGVNYSGQRAETLFFPRLDSKWLLHNQKCTAEFIDNLNQKPERKNNQWLYLNIDIKQLRQYIKNINIHSDNKMCNKELLLKYLDKAQNKKCTFYPSTYISGKKCSAAGTRSFFPSSRIQKTLCKHTEMNRQNEKKYILKKQKFCNQAVYNV